VAPNNLSAAGASHITPVANVRNPQSAMASEQVKGLGAESEYESFYDDEFESFEEEYEEEVEEEMA